MPLHAWDCTGVSANCIKYDIILHHFPLCWRFGHKLGATNADEVWLGPDLQAEVEFGQSGVAGDECVAHRFSGFFPLMHTRVASWRLSEPWLSVGLGRIVPRAMFVHNLQQRHGKGWWGSTRRDAGQNEKNEE
eukprot:3131129-Amphidinium_carterae.2